MVALELKHDTKKQRMVMNVNGKPSFVWDYKEQKDIQIDPDLIPAISLVNDPEDILFKDSVRFPDNLDDFIPKPQQETLEEDVEKISLVHSRKEESEKNQKKKITTEKPVRQPVDDPEDDDEDEQSIIVQKLRELVIRFEKLLIKYLDPDIPTGRKSKKKYLEEMDIFRKRGYREFIIAIDSKVDALCTYEKVFQREMFDGGEENGFKKKIKKALEGDFDTALQVVNAVEQIVTEEEYGVPKRRLVTKIK